MGETTVMLNKPDLLSVVGCCEKMLLFVIIQQFDPNLEPPTMSPFLGEIMTPYQSQHSLCDEQTKNQPMVVDSSTESDGVYLQSVTIFPLQTNESSPCHHLDTNHGPTSTDAISQASASHKQEDHEGRFAFEEEFPKFDVNMWDRIGTDGGDVKNGETEAEMFTVDTLEQQEKIGEGRYSWIGLKTIYMLSL